MNPRERKTGSGMAWTIARALLQLFLSVGVGVALARLLPPRDFGVVAIATGFAVLAEALAMAGLGSALIQKRRIRRATVETTWLLSLLLATLFLALFFAAAPILSLWFDAPELKPILPIIGATQAVMTLGIVPRALLRRHLHLKRLALIDLLSYALGYAAVSVTLAWHGWGAVSLAWGFFAWWLLATLLCWHASRIRVWRPRWSAQEGTAIVRYGLTLSAKGFIIYLGGALDSLILGWLLGPAPLGLYQRAAQLASIPLQRLGATVGHVMFPAFALIQENRVKLARALLDAQQTLALVCYPILAALAAVPEVVIVALYGDAWRDAAPILRILALIAMLHLTHHLAGPLLEACGRAKKELRLQSGYLGLLAVSLLVAAPLGLRAAAWAHLIPSLYLLATMGTVALGLLRLDWRPWLGANRAGLALAAATALTALLLSFSVRTVLPSASPITELLIVVLGCASVYGVGLWRIPGPHQRWWRKEGALND